MKPPKCRLCETEHWDSEPHNWPSKSVQKRVTAQTKEKVSRIASPKSLGEDKHCPTCNTNLSAKERERKRRREWMRKRRGQA